MHTTIGISNIKKYYLDAIESFEKNGGVLTPDALIDLSLQLFHNIQVKDVPTDSPENDMLLFQYGTYNWHDEIGEHFSFDITRQFIMDEEHENMYQLSWSLIFDPTLFVGTDADNNWSSDFNSVEEWAAFIKTTVGYQKAGIQIPKKYRLLFTEV